MKVQMRIRFKCVGHFAMDREHRISYRSDHWRCNAVVITPRKGHPGGPGTFGKSRTEFVRDGSEHRFKTLAALRRALARRVRNNP